MPCRELTEYSRPEAPDDDFISQYEKDLPTADGPTTTSHQLSPGLRLRASVMEKEIAGIVYNLVVVEQVLMRECPDRVMVLQKEDPHDRDSESQTLGTEGGTEPLRL